MGAYTPVPFFPPESAEAAMAAIVRPALAELARRGTPFRGVLFAGLMLTEDGPKLVEFNVRFGDPECQALLPRLRSDLLPALLAACDGELGDFDLRWRDEASVAVVVAARGYPGAPETGGLIGGLEQAEATPGVRVFQAATERRGTGLYAQGGRVLTVCGTGADLVAARAAAYRAIAEIRWPAGFFREDIGWRALARS
jgi:phosphoribosylamine--glycine ligase